MRWEDERQSDNVEDVRGDSGGGGFGGGGGLGGGFGLLGLLPLLLRGGPLGIIVLVIIGVVVLGGPLLRGGGRSSAPPSGYQGQTQPPGAQGVAGAQDEDIRFVRAVTAYTEDTWTEIFRDQGKTYAPPKVVVYTRARETGCGQGSAEMGPFYCPSDRKVYLDLSFFKELSGRFGAPGRFAQAYVIAHEVGHHVQNLAGTMDRNQRAGLGGGSRNQTSVRTELQADCYAGVWAARTNARTHFLDPGDIDQGLAAATAVGDDTLQRQAQGRVVPDSFTHGSSAQRVKWFRTGYDGGDMGACDTFSPGYDAL